MPDFAKNKKISVNLLSRPLAVIIVVTGSLVYGGMLTSSQYRLSVPMPANSSANTASPNYKIITGMLGQGLSGYAQSAGYHNYYGLVNQAAVIINSAAANLNDAYVYPNPYKPNSPGSFQADRLTFKHLPAQAAIRIFEITGRQVAALRKTDTAVDYYEWRVTDGDGQKLASGVYLYLITDANGGHVKGKFAVIR